jgi:hypothetical protein
MSNYKKVTFYLVIFILCIVVYLLLPCRNETYEVDEDTICQQHLKHIYRFLTEYRQNNGIYIPPITVDSNGRSLSWRYLLAKEDFNSMDIAIHYEWNVMEPWLHKYNQEEIAYPFFHCNTETDLRSYKEKNSNTSYLMLIHHFPMDDLPLKAVIIVESAGCGIHWMEPRDLLIDDILTSESPFGIGLLNSHHTDYVWALRKDGKVIQIPKRWSKIKVIRTLEGK